MNKKLNSLRVFTVALTIVLPMLTMALLYSKDIQLFIMWLVITGLVMFRIKAIKLLFNESKVSRSYIKSVMVAVCVNFVMLGMYFFIYNNVFLLFAAFIYSLFITYLFTGTVYKECKELIEKEF